jgi:hypothetical protein
MSPNDKNITHVLLNRVVSDVAVLVRLDGLVFLLTKDPAMVITSISTSKLPCGHIFGCSRSVKFAAKINYNGLLNVWLRTLELVIDTLYSILSLKAFCSLAAG